MFWFARKHIRTTETIRSPKEAEFLKKYGFDAYIVGSDQVWRPTYSPGMPMFFLDFLGEDATTRRIAYAASFGTDSWEFSSRLTRQCRKLAKKFHAISVREDSGVTLCQKHLGVKSQHVIDPTMLLNPSDYNMLIEDDTHAPGKISTYIFKRSSLAMKVVKFAEKEFGKQEQRLFPYRLNEARKERIPDEKCKFSSMSDWLKGIRDADFVITDSFHGTVFSIIYNKPFLVIGNIRGGLARFQSILKQFGLENRYISSEDQLSPQLLSATIDWAYVNSIRGKLIANAETFLTRALYPENKKNENHGFYAGV